MKVKSNKRQRADDHHQKNRRSPGNVKGEKDNPDKHNKKDTESSIYDIMQKMENVANPYTPVTEETFEAVDSGSEFMKAVNEMEEKYKKFDEAEVTEDPTPKRRIMDFDNHSAYYDGTGQLQQQFGDLAEKLVPDMGKADTVEGELLRAVAKIIYRHGNDGDNFSNASYEWIEKHVGAFDNLDEMATKTVQYVLDKNGDYTPNKFDWLTIADYGPGEHEKDWQQVGCNNCGGSGEIEYENDDGEEEYEECDSCDGNGWIEQTSESVVNELKVKSNKRQRADDHHQKNRRTPGNVKGVRADTKDLKNASRDETKKDSNFEKVQEGSGLYPYKGWEYEQEIDHWPDVSKIDHIAKKDGKEVDIDWSPYTNMTEEQFKTWIDLGMPDRKAVNGIGPLDHNDLDSLMKTKLGTKARLTQEAKDDKKADKKTKDAGSDLTSKMDVKTKMALKKQQARSAGITKGDPVAALAMGLEKDVKTNKKDIDKAEENLTKQLMFDKYLDDKVEKIQKELDAKDTELDAKVNKAIATLDQKKTPKEEEEKDKKQDDEIDELKARMDKLMGRG